jgi:chloramphenicol 3-O-phosphotransferase
VARDPSIDPGSLLIISGPPGAGKSAVARALVPLLPPPVANVEGDAFWPFFAPGANVEPHARFLSAMRAMSVTAISLARDGYNTILDFSIPPRSLEVVRARLKGTNVPLHYVVLLPSIEVCAKRSEQRTAGAIAYTPQLRGFYESFITEEFAAIEDDDASVALLATRVRQGWAQGRFRLT